jgi:hypothetical protein
MAISSPIQISAGSSGYGLYPFPGAFSVALGKEFARHVQAFYLQPPAPICGGDRLRHEIFLDAMCFFLKPFKASPYSECRAETKRTYALARVKPFLGSAGLRHNPRADLLQDSTRFDSVFSSPMNRAWV